MARVVTEVGEHFGALDIVVNDAGIAALGVGIEDDGFDTTWDTVIAVNLTAQQRIVRAALPWLRRSASPRIVNIASTEGLGASPRDTHYAASKAGVIGLTRAPRARGGPGQGADHRQRHLPGPIETPMTSFVADDDKATFARLRTALRRYGRPEEVAHMTLSLCLPAALALSPARSSPSTAASPRAMADADRAAGSRCAADRRCRQKWYPTWSATVHSWRLQKAPRRFSASSIAEPLGYRKELN
ncbi:SDR family NAD(P)-dependent oxidoreductase [Sphingomonas sp. MMS24-JH45]